MLNVIFLGATQSNLHSMNFIGDEDARLRKSYELLRNDNLRNLSWGPEGCSLIPFLTKCLLGNIVPRYGVKIKIYAFPSSSNFWQITLGQCVEFKSIKKVYEKLLELIMPPVDTSTTKAVIWNQCGWKLCATKSVCNQHLQPFKFIDMTLWVNSFGNAASFQIPTMSVIGLFCCAIFWKWENFLLEVILIKGWILRQEDFIACKFVISRIFGRMQESNIKDIRQTWVTNMFLAWREQIWYWAIFFNFKYSLLLCVFRNITVIVVFDFVG